jgi:hypothetical protein
MLTGSIAAGYYGAVRATIDLDLVIDPQPNQLDAFVRRIAEKELYVSDVAAREALAARSLFNVVDPASGWKADLIVRKLRPFSEEEFSRKHLIDFLGVSVDVASLEDVILSKLEWAKLGDSARQLEDAAALVGLWREEIDASYLGRWAADLRVEPQWRAALALADR